MMHGRSAHATVLLGLLAMMSDPAGAIEPERTVRLGDERFSAVVVVDPSGLHSEFGPRFDQTALVRQVTLDGHTFLFEPWGLVDEFGITGHGIPGFDDAGPGEPFLKIGVGVLVRDDEKPYRFFHPYPVRERAPVALQSHNERSLVVTQAGSWDGWGYRYLKRYLVDPATATLRIDYELTNTGTRPLSFDQYNHNWFRFDDAPIGPEYGLTPTFAVDDQPAEWFTREGDTLTVAHLLTRGRSFMSAHPSSPDRNRATLHHENGLSVEIVGGFAVARFMFYADANAVCPEMFYESPVLHARQKATWTRTYRFTAPPLRP